MGEIDFRGPGRRGVVQHLVTNDIGKLVDGRAAYTVTCHETGGIVDDCIVYRLGPEHFRIVVNASNIAKDFASLLRAQRRHGVCDRESLRRVRAARRAGAQGAGARRRAGRRASARRPDVRLRRRPRGRRGGAPPPAPATPARTASSCSSPAERARPVWDAFVQAGAAPIGLGARDTLRLEARLCLYGNDIDDDTDPFAAQLGWVVKLDKGIACVGQAALERVKAAGPTRKLVGWKLVERGIVRDHAEVIDDSGAVIGRVTSGGVAPTVGGAVGMAYVPSASPSPVARSRCASAARPSRRSRSRARFTAATLDLSTTLRAKERDEHRDPGRPPLHQGTRVGPQGRRPRRRRHHVPRGRAAR